MDALLRWSLMRLPPERAHAAALRGLALAAALPGGRSVLRARYAPPDDPVQVGGLLFPNRIGLAAGYDKDAVAVAGLDALGFGHLELGTVTPEPQEGNPGVRIVRLPEHGALVNRMGFPSRGVDAFVDRLSRVGPVRAVLGANLGKNRHTPNDRAADDYLRGFRAVHPHVAYVTVNVSSPNTKGLRDLAAPDVLAGLLRPLVDARDGLSPHRPIWVKLAPDATAETLRDAAKAVRDAGADALVLTNTTVSRPVACAAEGGLSGRPLGALALSAVEAVAGQGLPVVAVGGIGSREDVRRRLDAGASLVQVYTSLVFGGPGILQSL
ncbi:MAG: quinone-dependent dihydroorotate dehydrogenase [Alphaproteobacteria bacterium]|nr:quinone-dependent dihydroorotate dehydrogenase [Alphaproteobacteria bacterium]MCB9692425.1 quinone-dependent dihydroorotate dehydrogenase [Alphaproteobacteria bacterium]